VLLVPARGPEDDFFESGGDSLKAIHFVVQLERALGQELSPTLLNEAPSFGELCDVLRGSRSRSDDLLVTLKPGDGLPPVFFIHGVGGNVTEMLPTARRVPYGGAMIGIRARGLVRGETPHSSVHAMAAEYLKEIKHRQPVGPYHLCGYSFGGLVAFEIARQLSESGNEVAFVGLFDTLMSPIRWPLRAWITMARDRVVRLCNSLLRRPTARVSPAPTSASTPGGELSTPPIMLRVAASALFASARYRPGFYQGRLTLFTPAEREPGLPSLAAIWRKHAAAASLIETEGSHASMLSAANADATAALLARAIALNASSQAPPVGLNSPHVTLLRVTAR
jgi:thioesterase domain-containing protein